LKVVAANATALWEKRDMDDGKPKLLDQLRQQI
jgi:hypothetical protein